MSIDMKSLLGFVVLVLCFGCSHSFVDKTVYQYLVDNGYDSFARLLQEANADKELQGPGPFTVFAPSDAAISMLDPDVMVSLGHNVIQLSQVIKYHAAIGFILIPQVQGQRDITTLSGQKINAVRVNSSLLLNNESNVSTASEVICNNGVVYGIDKVLLPPVFGTSNIASVLIVKDDMFKDTFMAFLLSDLSHLLEAGEYTLFAPVDAAWAKYQESILHPTRVSNLGAIYYEMLKYHMVPGARTSSMLKDGDQLYTLHGTPVNITKTSNAKVNDANIITADIPASNGVIHAIDNLLFPRDLLVQLIKDYQASHNYTVTG